MNLVLASGSPRRAELLHRLGIAFESVPADIDETRLPGEPPGVYVERVARAKATAIGTESLVIAADTAVVFEGHVMGKPSHPAEAKSMLSRLAGKPHEVFTGLAVRLGADVESVVDVTEVRMMDMTEVEIADYVNSGEPMDKAGAYALQGSGGLFVEAVHGSPFTVIGLPIHLMARLCRQLGCDLDDFKATKSV